MNFKFFLVAMALVSVATSGCGRSQSSNDDDNKLLTEDEKFLQFCTDFPDARECDEINQNADKLGLFEYYGGGDDFFSDSAFSNSGVGCGCRNGERPVFIQGVRRCEPEQVYEQVRVNQLSMRYVSRPNGREKLWVAFDTATVTVQNQTHAGGFDDAGGSNCYADFGARCDLANGHSDCQGMTDFFGASIEARCVAIDGLGYGTCEKAETRGGIRF